MDAGYTVYFAHRRSDRFQVEPARDTLQQYVGGIAQECPGAGQHPQANANGEPFIAAPRAVGVARCSVPSVRVVMSCTTIKHSRWRLGFRQPPLA